MKLDLNQMKPKERTLVFQLLEALIHAQTLPELVRTTERILTRLTSADCMALCASRMGLPNQEDWLVANMPDVYFAHYQDWKQNDVIRDANVKNPNRVMRDGEIIGRKELTSSFIYRIGHEMRVPLEQVMSVYLTDTDWEGNGGFSAYRLKPRPFSDYERNILQYIAPHLASAIKRCQMFMERELTGRLLEIQTAAQKTASLVLTTRCEVVKSVGPISHLKDKWFSDIDCGPSGLPPPLVEKLNTAMLKASFLDTGAGDWSMEGDRETLRVTFFQLPREGAHPYWQLRFQEVTHPWLVIWLKHLTAKEVEIANLLAQGLSDKEIAKKTLNIREGKPNSPETVKKHLRHICEKLGRYGILDRADFMAKAHLPSKEDEDEED